MSGRCGKPRRPFLHLLTPKYVARFHSRVDHSGGPDACWPWTRNRLRTGYGQFWVKDRVILAHRFAWTLANGREIPEDIHAIHACDNPPCCNPRHLSLGTQADNLQDGARKGRVGGMRGKTVAKTTPEQVQDIRELAEIGATYEAIGALYGLSAQAVCHIVLRRRRASVPDRAPVPSESVDERESA